MAIMYPNSIEDYNYTESEKKFYEVLKYGLSDEFKVFYSVTWYSESNGVKENSECDFLVFNPKYGYITIEVKGGIKIEKVNDEWRIYDYHNSDSYRVLRRSPFRQSEESMRYFKQYYEKQFGSFYRGTYGFAVAFPFYEIKSDIATNAPSELIIDRRDMDNIEEKIISILNYWRGKHNNFLPFSAEQQVKFINIINKRISLSAAAGSLIELRERQLNEFNRVQDNYIKLLSNYKQVFISGGAGTGKTWIGIKKARKDINEEKKVLFLCSSNLLSDYIKQNINEVKVKCKSFNEIVNELIGAEEYCKLYNNSAVIEGVSEYFNTLNFNEKYDSIIIDEAQDFNAEWAYCIRKLLRNQDDSELYVFYDTSQNLYNRDFKNAFGIDNPPFILYENVRNTSGIYKWTIHQTGIGHNVKPNTIEGVEPERIKFSTNKGAIVKLESILNTLVMNENVSAKSIVVLSNKNLEESILKGKKEFGQFKFITEGLEVGENEILFKTEQQYKGLEANVIIYLNHLDNKELRNYKFEYVAYTRARFYLYVIEIEE